MSARPSTTMISLAASKSWSCRQVFWTVLFYFADFHGVGDFFVDVFDAWHGFDVPFVQDFFCAVNDDFSACFAYVFDFFEADFG